MTRTSEWVSPGHPDKVADGIVSFLLDRFIERDPKTRFGLECQIKDNFVTLGGEITSSVVMSEDVIAEYVAEAVKRIGYTEKYARRWGLDNCICPTALTVAQHIGMQSPDISQGVDAGGWGDQGIMWGMATGDERTDYMPVDHWLAKLIGTILYENAYDGRLDIGLDIKTQVTIVDGEVVRVIVAAPMRDRKLEESVRDIAIGAIDRWYYHGNGKPHVYDVIVNGTGAYVRHASQGDCGTTGRKLAVDFYGGNCRIGGGCPWGKDPSKADVALNIYARRKALAFLKEHLSLGTVYCSIACCIGQRYIEVAYFDGQMEQVDVGDETRPADAIIDEIGLRRPVYAFLNRNGLFTDPSLART